MKIIAEVGSNFKSFSDCIKCIEMAKDAGADIVKFQIATFEELYGKPDYICITQQQRDYINRFDCRFVRRDWVPQLKKFADSIEIEFMCSAFSLEGYEFIDNYVKKHKIASCENNLFNIHKFMLKAKKEVIISTGVTSVNLLKKLISFYEKVSKNVTFMLCSSSYPTNDLPLWLISDYQYLVTHNYNIGVSDHTKKVLINPHYNYEDESMTQILYYEKHINPLGYTDTPDSGHSLDYSELKAFVINCRDKFLRSDLVRAFMNKEYYDLKHKIKRQDNGFRPLPEEFLELT